MPHHYDTRRASCDTDRSTRVTLAEKADTSHVTPRYWVAETEVDRKLDVRWETWLLRWHDICRVTDAGTVITSMLPRCAEGNKIPLALPARAGAELQASCSSFAAGSVAHQKVGGTRMHYFIFMQLPMPTPDQIEVCPFPLHPPAKGWIAQRVDRSNARPTRTNAEAQAVWRAELDALAVHLYGLDRDEIDHILETFPIVKRQEETAHGEYRTKRLILAAYDEMQHARTTGQSYTSITVEVQ